MHKNHCGQRNGVVIDGPESLCTDPVFNFMASPSVYMEGSTAERLKDIRTRAMKAESNYRKKIIVEGTTSTRKETAILQDGTVYILTDTWTMAPSSSRLTSTESQTEGVFECEKEEIAEEMDSIGKRKG